jgi:hypothetical protein
MAIKKKRKWQDNLESNKTLIIRLSKKFRRFPNFNISISKNVYKMRRTETPSLLSAAHGVLALDKI